MNDRTRRVRASRARARARRACTSRAVVSVQMCGVEVCRAAHIRVTLPPMHVEMVHAQLYERTESAQLDVLRSFLRAHNLPVSENKPELALDVNESSNLSRR